MADRPADRVILRPVTPDDDPELRRILKDVASGGDISLRVEKEPAYFLATQVEGEMDDAVVGIDPELGRPIGFGSMSEKRCFVNGSPEPEWIGYLANLRIERPYRSGGLLLRGYREFRRMHEERRSSLYLTTIMEDNLIARRALTANRTGMPLYRDHGRLNTYILGTRRSPWRGARPPGPETRTATLDDLPAVEAFWQTEGPKRQFFPAYKAGHLTQETGLLRGLEPKDLHLALRNGEITGTAAIWDQRACRQWVIDAYSRRAAVARPLYNLYARATGRPTFPPPGQHLDYRFLALTCIRDDDLHTFKSLLDDIWRRGDVRGPGRMVMAAFHQRDPLAALFRPLPHICFRSRLYLVHWDDGSEAHGALDNRIPYVELGGL